MAYDDIQIHNGSYSCQPRVMYFPMETPGATTNFTKGDVVRITNANSRLVMSTARPTSANIAGIAMAGPGQAEENGTTPTAGVLIRDFTNPQAKTGTAFVLNSRIPVMIATPDVLWRTRNFTSAGAAFNDVAPALAQIGDEASLDLISHATTSLDQWGVDISAGAGTADVIRIVDVLDDKFVSIRDSGKVLTTSDVYWVVFSILAHQFTNVAGQVEALP